MILINFRDNGIYFGTPIYARPKFFYYYLSPVDVLKFDIDDLFYYSSRKIMKRGEHLFVADYGMQVNILNRYGIRSFAVAGKDYLFLMMMTPISAMRILRLSTATRAFPKSPTRENSDTGRASTSPDTMSSDTITARLMPRSPITRQSISSKKRRQQELHSQLYRRTVSVDIRRYLFPSENIRENPELQNTRSRACK